MRWIRYGHFLLSVTLGFSLSAWGQGGSGRAGRGTVAQTASPQGAVTQGAQAQQPGTPAPPTGRGGRGAAAGGAAANIFYNYDPTAASGMAIPDAKPAETHQKITINGETLGYTARVGFLPLHNATTGQSEAHLFFTYYAKDGVTETSARPLMFFLGGAPGVSAGWQEFGGLGPKRIKWNDDGAAPLPPYVWEDNPNSLLSQADLVFGNPVGTAYSRPNQPSRAQNFWNAAGDVASMGEFVRTFANTYDRRNSPLFLAGDDFGSGRAAGLAAYLTEHQMPVSGVVLLSMTPSSDAVAGDEQFITLLPSQIMAAWYHKKLAPELTALSAERMAEQARQFASREYLHALYRGDRMSPEERKSVVANLSRLTGLPQAFLVNNNLRIPLDRFNTELLRDRRTALSSSDARVTGFVPAAGGGGRGGFGAGAVVNAIDYNESNLAGALLTAYETYLRRDLTYANTGNSIYYLQGGGVGTFTSAGNDDASLAAAFARNPNLHLFVAANLFDLGAPFYATEFTLAHLSVSPQVRARNITVGHFAAGRMPYLDAKSLARLHLDLARFISETVSRHP